jgi:CPA2 family monovalent cation:H+ antiporter-2
VLAGLALGQMGEFSFILAGSGLSEGIISPVQYQWFLAAAVASIGLTPFLVAGAPRLADALGRLPLPRRLEVGGLRYPTTPSGDTEVGDHAIVVGFGVNGGNVARAASLASIPFVAVEMNPTVVRAERERGLPILFGDASQRAVLEHAGIQRARVVVVAISDAAATRRVTALARSLNPGCRIIARTRYMREVDVLKAAGADVVVPEELETSLEIVARVLTSYLVPRRDIEAFLAEVRAGEYEMLRSRPGTAPGLADLELQLSEMEVSTLRVDAGSALDGRRLSETDLRPVYGITVVAIRREEALIPNPGAGTRIQAGDALVLLGLGEEISGAAALFRNL